jgi:hypothetical protein
MRNQKRESVCVRERMREKEGDEKKRETVGGEGWKSSSDWATYSCERPVIVGHAQQARGCLVHLVWRWRVLVRRVLSG